MSTENFNTVAPTGKMQMAMIAPEMSGGFTKRDNISLFPNSMQPAVIYAVVGLGTHVESFQGQEPKDKNKIHIGFEFPQKKELFYEEDTVPRSTVLSVESTFNMGERSKLRAIAEAVIGRPFSSNDEANNFDVSQLVGAKVLVNVGTKTSKKTGKQYNNVINVSPITGYQLPADFNPELKYYLFAIDPEGANFRTMNYAELPRWMKSMILESKEAKKYASNGGAFAEMPKDENANSNGYGQQAAPAQQAAAPAQPAAPAPAAPAAPSNPGQPVFELLDTQFTLAQWEHAGWTKQNLVDAKKARWVKPEPAAAPAAPAPAAPAPAAPPQQSVPGSSTPVAGETPVWDDEDDDMPY